MSASDHDTLTAPPASDPASVGTHDQFAPGVEIEYIDHLRPGVAPHDRAYDAVLEYRVWVHPAPGSGRTWDYYQAFATLSEAAQFSKATPGSESPVVVVRRGDESFEWLPDWLVPDATPYDASRDPEIAMFQRKAAAHRRFLAAV